jgi:hypothetical protein
MQRFALTMAKRMLLGSEFFCVFVNLNHGISSKINQFIPKTILVIALLCISWVTQGQEILRNENENSQQPDRLLLPFAFYNDTIGTAIGATYAGSGREAICRRYGSRSHL